MLDLDSVPHRGKATSSTPHPGARLTCRVVIRPGITNKILPDGRGYGPGEHTVQVYKGDLANMQCLVETREDLLEQATARHEAKVAEWIDATRNKMTGAPGRNVEGNYIGGSVQSEFRALTIGTPDGKGGRVGKDGRGIRPLLSCDVIGDELPSVKEEEHLDQMRAAARVAREQMPSAGISQDQVQAMIDVAVARAVAALTDPTPAPDAARKAGK